jgi:hypothetical protein
VRVAAVLAVLLGALAGPLAACGGSSMRSVETVEPARDVERAEAERLLERAEAERLLERAEAERLLERAEAERLLERAEAERLLDEVLSRPETHCASACDLGDRICALSSRLCDLAARHPGDGQLAARCGDGEARCASARERIGERCTCGPG